MKTLAVSSSVVPCQEYFGLSGLVLEMGKPSRPSQMADRDAEGGVGDSWCWSLLPLSEKQNIGLLVLEAHQEGEPTI